MKFLLLSSLFLTVSVFAQSTTTSTTNTSSTFGPTGTAGIAGSTNNSIANPGMNNFPTTPAPSTGVPSGMILPSSTVNPSTAMRVGNMTGGVGSPIQKYNTSNSQLNTQLVPLTNPAYNINSANSNNSGNTNNSTNTTNTTNTTTTTR